MSIDINLISKVTSEGTRDSRLRKIKTLSYATLIVVALLALVLFLINIRFSVNYVKNQQNKVIESLATEDKTAVKIFLLDQRLNDISSIINKRRKYHEKTAEILKGLPDSISVDTYQIDDSGVTLQLTSTSLLELNDFLNGVLKLSKSKKVGSVTLTSLSLEKSGYLLAIKIN